MVRLGPERENWMINRGSVSFQPQVYEIDGKTYTAYSPQEAQALQQRRMAVLNQTAGQPKRPSFDSMIDKRTGLLNTKFQIGGAANQMMADDKGFNKFESEALRDGPSVYANLMMQEQGLANQDRMGDINSQYQMGLQNASDQLASQGGLFSGARERMGAGSIRDMLASRQGARQDFEKNKLGIQAQDEQNRLTQLQALTGMEQQRNQMGLQAKEFDLRNSMNERDAKRKDGMDAWKVGMETWASNKQADAQAASAGGGGCFPAGTMVEMHDGTQKKIEDIKIGDETFGGKVTKVIVGEATGFVWYDYNGVIVTGDHPVMESGAWVRVKDSKQAEELEVEFDVLYNLSNVGHVIIINNFVFSDFDEVDQVGLSYEESLKLKNEEVKCTPITF